MDSVGTNGVRSNDLVELRKYEQSVKRHSTKDQPTDNLCKTSSDDQQEKMVYLLQLLPTYLLHLTYGISLGALSRDLCEHLGNVLFQASPVSWCRSLVNRRTVPSRSVLPLRVLLCLWIMPPQFLYHSLLDKCR